MEIEKKCKKCHTDLIILESPLLFSQEKVMETVECPICQSEVYKNTTDGWYFIQTKENSKNETRNKCVYPMP